MLAPGTLQHIDQLLNELEELAHSETPAAQFLSVLCDRLLYLTGAQGARVLLPTDASWQSTLPLAQAGQIDQPAIEQLIEQVRNASNGTSSLVAAASAKPYWVAAPLRASQWSKGLILLTLSPAPSDEARHSLIELLTAFAEVASLKQLIEIERFLDGRWQALQETLARIARSDTMPGAALAFVNQLGPVLGADRISLAHPSLLKGLELTAVSGISQLDPSTDTAHALRELAHAAYRQGQAVVRHAHQSPASSAPLDDDGLFRNLVAVPLTSSKSSSTSLGVLIVEWATYPKMFSALPVLNQVQPLLNHFWEQQRRWLKIPVWVRRAWDWNASLPGWSLRWIRWAIVLLLCLAAYRGLTIDAPLTIEAPAYLEPAVKRSVFATADGYVDSLLVDDGQEIVAGTVVARLRSPLLDLQMEELRGQLRSLAERRSGLRIAINQIDPAMRDALVQQSRLSAEITQLNTQEANTQKQLKLLSDERQKLELVAPISGRVVARELKQQLLQRPVRRGDALFTIVDLNGPWHLRIEVPDRDTGYVRSKLQPASADDSTRIDSQLSDDVQFILDSLPEQRFTAKVNWLSDTVQNRPGEGCYWEVRASIDRSIVEQSHMGAGALAYFQCGQAPLWFVWCRPLVEAAQRKFWILSQGDVNEVTGE